MYLLHGQYLLGLYVLDAEADSRGASPYLCLNAIFFIEFSAFAFLHYSMSKNKYNNIGGTELDV
jgi:hypothetical protein